MEGPIEYKIIRAISQKKKPIELREFVPIKPQPQIIPEDYDTNPEHRDPEGYDEGWPDVYDSHGVKTDLD